MESAVNVTNHYQPCPVTEVPEFPLTYMCVYMMHKNIKERTCFGAHASQGPTKSGYDPDIFATVLENPYVLH